MTLSPGRGRTARKELVMCHGYEWEVMKQAYMEQLKRKERERDEAQRKHGGNVAPAKPAEPAPRVRDKEPVPA
jgi:hypothetical protein